MKIKFEKDKKTTRSIKASVIKSVCLGGRKIEKYSPKNFTEITRTGTYKWTSSTKDKSVLQMLGEGTIEYQGFIHWN